MKQTIVVCGATGQQGSWVIKALEALEGQFDIVAFSRDPRSAKAKALTERGITVRRGDLLDASTLTRIFEGAYGVFGVTQPWAASYRSVDVAGEIAQGKNIIDACVRAGVKHLVLSTAMTIGDDLTGLSHIDSKLEVERYLQTTDVPWTLLRPGTFMDNIGQHFFPVKRGVVRGFAAGDAKLPWIACRDIGLAARVAFVTPDRWRHEAVNLVGDHISGDELAKTLGRLRKESFRYTAPPAALMLVVAPEFFRMRRALEKAGRPPYPFHAPLQRALAETKAMIGDPWSVERWLSSGGGGWAAS